MMKFCIKAFIIAILTISLDVASGYLFGFLLSRLPDKAPTLSNMYQNLMKKRTDLLILGPSKANHHYKPDIFEHVLSLDTYNAGLDGTDIVYSNIVFKSYLGRKKPQMVVLDISEGQLTERFATKINEAKCLYRHNIPLTEYFDRESTIIVISNFESPNFRKVNSPF